MNKERSLFQRFKIGSLRLGESRGKLIESQDLRRLRKMLVESTGHSLEENVEESAYKTLFHAIAHKNEETSKYFRRLSRKEIFELIGFSDSPIQSEVDINEYISRLLNEALRRLSPVLLDVLGEGSTQEILNSTIGIKSESSKLPDYTEKVGFGNY